MGILNTYFTTQQLLPLFPGALMVLLSIVLFHMKEYKRPALVLLILGGLGIRIFMALLDPYLNMWDEQWHALVAKNMLLHPFKPTLYENPVMPYSFENWAGNHVWLHKQPLFLWKIALSLWLFGTNTFAVRLPSVILSTIMIYLIYRMGKITLNQRAGFYAALLFTTSTFFLDLVSGFWQTDHNDVAFIFYVTASVWAWVEYNESGKKKFLIWIGVFSGCAMLVKWLSGLLVFAGWGMSLLMDPSKRTKFTHYLAVLKSLVISFIIFLPWQFFTAWAYPAESAFERTYNAMHFGEVLETHSGTFWFHFEQIPLLYGGIFQYLIPVALIVFFFALKKKDYKTAFFTNIFVGYLFYSLAATKMISYTLFLCSFIYLALGSMMDEFFKVIIINKEIVKLRVVQALFPVIMIISLAFYNLNIEKIQYNHTPWKKGESNYPDMNTRDTKIIQKLPQLLHNGNYIIFNCRQTEYVWIMFYTNYIAYQYMINAEDVKNLKAKNYKIAVFDNDQLPEFMLNDKDVLKIRSGIWQFPRYDDPEVYY